MYERVNTGARWKAIQIDPISIVGSRDPVFKERSREIVSEIILLAETPRRYIEYIQRLGKFNANKLNAEVARQIYLYERQNLKANKNK